LLSKYWRAILLEPSFWRSKPLNLSQRLRKIKLLAERRSKGKQFAAVDRVSNEMRAVRKILLDVTNAGQDDGLPTSILRELSYLKSLNHNNVTR
jgi:serine/threonine protein kinase